MTFLVNPLPLLNGNDEETDIHWMNYALQLAEHAMLHQEVPIGAVLVLDNTVIGVGHNASIASHDPTAHAEIVALRAAGHYRGNYRLINSTLYVTLEPCLMCAGAMVHARIKRLVYGAKDNRRGVASTQCNIFDQPFLNHRISITSGILEKECGDILKNFFKIKRK